ncbi:MAG: endonuclease III [Rickettsiales bacterium]|nr:endonuclease III [Rickettsiales bacterium]
MNKQALTEIFSRLQAADPEPVTELDYTNEFTLLVAIVLSAQATDVGVNKATKALFAKYDTPHAMLELGLEGLKGYIKTIGLFNSKAKNVIALCEMLIHVFGNEIPETTQELIKLPGVGTKTAAVWLNCARDHPTIAVDTHVFRVANRTGMVKTKTTDATQQALEKKVPAEFKQNAHHWMILHGRYTCKARKPMCFNCRIDDICRFKQKTPPPEGT